MSLDNVFDVNFKLSIILKQNISELETMIPWERDIHLDMLRRHIEEENLKIKNAENDNALTKIMKNRGYG